MICGLVNNPDKTRFKIKEICLLLKPRRSEEEEEEEEKLRFKSQD